MFGLLQWFVIICGIAGLIWAYINYSKLKEVDLGN